MYAHFDYILLRSSLDFFICTDDDFAVSVLAGLLNKSEDAQFFRQRSMITPFTIYNNETDFMEAKNADGSWAGADMGWTVGGSYPIIGTYESMKLQHTSTVCHRE